MHGHGGLVSEKTAMHVRQIAESGSYARFFFQLIAMYLIVSGLAFCLIAAAYAEGRPLKPSAGIISKNLRSYPALSTPNTGRQSAQEKQFLTFRLQNWPSFGAGGGA